MTVWITKITKIPYNKQTPRISLRNAGVTFCQKTILTFFAASSRIFVFLATGAAEKLLISENRLFSGFQGHVGGIGGSGVQYENFLILAERHSRQESDNQSQLKYFALDGWLRHALQRG